MVFDEIVVEDANSASGYASPNDYLNKSGGKYAKSIAEPLNYSFIFVAAMILGGFLASKLQTTKESEAERRVPAIWRERFGDSTRKRYLVTFVAGFLSLFGARLAGGCGSGHMMSGMMQTSVSGYLFALGAFIVAVPLARFIYKEGK